MKNIDIYNNRFSILKTINKKVYIQYLFFLVIFVLMILILLVIEYPNVYKVEGFSSEDKIVIPISRKDLEQLKGNVLKIDDEIFKYSIFSYEVLDEYSNYSDEILVTLLVDKKIESNKVVSVVIENGKTNLYKSFVKKMWKGF